MGCCDKYRELWQVFLTGLQILHVLKVCVFVHVPAHVLSVLEDECRITS